MKRWITPAATLFLLSPVVGELLSGSAPPAEFFNPVTFLLLAGFYGSGALLVRELTHRWGKGWPTILTLGAAYGIIEEGLAVKSFFDPQWMDLGALSQYGRWAGVNWVWVVELTLYHAVFSIAIPILLTELLFPRQRDQSWVSPRAFRRLAWLFASLTAFMHFMITPYRPPLIPFALAAAMVVWLYRRARRLPASPTPPPARRVGSPRRYGWMAFATTATFFLFLSWIIPNSPIPPLVDVLLYLGMAAWLYRKLARAAAAGPPAWTRRHALALASGALSFLILLQPIIEMDQTRPDDTRGATLVGLAAAGFLIWLARRVRREEGETSQGSSTSTPLSSPA